MMGNRGASAQKTARAAAPAGGGGGTDYDLMVDEGESVPVRFGGSFDTEFPVFDNEHYFQGRARDSYQWCSLDPMQNPDLRIPKPGFAGCVYHESGSKAGGKALYWVLDMRLIHKLDNPVTVAGRKNQTKWPPHSAQNCQFCRMDKNKPQTKGWTKLKLPGRTSEAFLAKRDAVRNRCLCGAVSEMGEGTIEAHGWLCGNDKCWDQHDPVSLGNHWQGPGTPFLCAHCGSSEIPYEWISCTECQTPARCDMGDFIWDVLKTGSLKKTEWSVTMRQVKPRRMSAEEDELMRKYMPDWNTATLPKSCEQQAAFLGIGNPFPPVAGHGAVAYGGVSPQHQEFAHGGQEEQQDWGAEPNDSAGDTYVDQTPEYQQAPPKRTPPPPIQLGGLRPNAAPVAQPRVIQARPNPAVQFKPAGVQTPKPVAATKLTLKKIPWA